MTAGTESLERLKQGNLRFVAGERESGSIDPFRRAELAAGQSPFAIILGCSDSRVPVELVFDQGLGDLFVVRVAGNVATEAQIGSVEFAAAVFGCDLVVVLGHSHCGAIEATLNEIRQPTEALSPNLRSIVDPIRSALCPLLDASPETDHPTLVRNSIRANVRASVDRLRHGSEVLGRLIGSRRLKIVGAEYDLATGEVEFLDPVTDE